MIARYNNISLAVGIPGIVLQIIGQISGHFWLVLVGGAMLIVGLAYYAMAKGRSPVWGIMGLLSCLGLLVLALLKDLTDEQGRKLRSAGKRPESGNPYQSPFE